MRQLTSKQKALLAKALQKNKRDKFGTLHFEIYSVDDLSFETWQKLREINDTEVLYQNVNRFIQDHNSKLSHC